MFCTTKSQLLACMAWQAALGVAFVVEGLLLGFHLKGSDLEVVVHKILVITIAMSAVVIFAEIRSKSTVLLTLARSLLVILQGIWFVQIGLILFKRAPAAWLPTTLPSHQSCLRPQALIVYTTLDSYCQ